MGEGHVCDHVGARDSEGAIDKRAPKQPTHETLLRLIHRHLVNRYPSLAYSFANKETWYAISVVSPARA